MSALCNREFSSVLHSVTSKSCASFILFFCFVRLRREEKREEGKEIEKEVRWEPGVCE